MRAFLMYIDDWLSSKQIALMDAAEERGYLRLLLYAASEPDCGLPDSDSELAFISLLGSQWGKPTADESRRLGALTSGDKLRRCFYLKTNRLFNDKLAASVRDLPDPGGRAWLERMTGRITPSIRTEVFTRDGDHCLKCFATSDLTVDHIKPITKGGTLHLSNLQTLCRPCNSRKGNRA
jgi:hypothetical protein